MTVVSMCHISSGRVVRSTHLRLRSDARGAEDVAIRASARGGTTSRARRRRCRAAARGPQASASARDGRPARSPCLRSPGPRRASVDAVTCGDMTPDRRAHTRAAGGARRETGSATDAGTAGSLAAGCTCGRDSTARRIRALAGPSGRRSPVSRTLAAWSHGKREPEQGRELLDASLQRQDLLPKFCLRQVRSTARLTTACRRSAEPPTRRRSRDAAIRGEAELARASDEFPEPMVITLLPAGGRGHAGDHRPCAHSAPMLENVAGVRRRQSPGKDDNSRRKLQNVRADSSAGRLRGRDYSRLTAQGFPSTGRASGNTLADKGGVILESEG